MTDLDKPGSGSGGTVATGDGASCPGFSSHNVEATVVFYPCAVSRENALLSLQGWWEEAGCMKAENIGRGHIVEAITDWDHHKVITRDLVNRAAIGECKLCYVPFWKCAASVAGTIEGVNPDYDSSVRASRTIAKTYVWTSVAVSDRDIRVKFLRKHQGMPMPCNVCSIPAYPVVSSADEAYVNGHKAIKAAAIKFAAIAEVKSAMLDQTHRSLELVYYPLWIMSYCFSSRSYSATVDGVTGKILAGSAPGDGPMRVVAFVTAILLNLALIAVNVALVILWNAYLCCAAILFFGDLLELMAVVFIAEAISYFFYGVEITTGDEGGGYRPWGTARGIRGAVKIITLLLLFAALNYLGYIYIKYGGPSPVVVLFFLLLIAFILASGILYDNDWEPGADVLEADL